ncbi:MAG: hypothetical protein ACK4Z0_01940, partial [Sphingomonadaceae bacterium]
WCREAGAALAPPGPSAGSGRRGMGRFQPGSEPIRPETRAAASGRPELTTAMLLRRLADEPGLAAEHLESLAELPIASPSLALARDHLLAGRPAQALLRGYRALSVEPGRIADTLASLVEAHHMGHDRRRRAGSDDVESWEEAYERNRAAARDYPGRVRLTAALRHEAGEA